MNIIQGGPEVNAKDTYKQVRNEMGKDVLKALAFFFIGLPLLITGLVFLIF